MNLHKSVPSLFVPFSETEKKILQSSREEFLNAIKVGKIKPSEALDVFGHEDTEGIIRASAGPLRNTVEGRAESHRWLPPDLFQGKDILIFGGGGNLPFVLLQFGARSVTIADIDPITLAWQRAKVVYGGSPEIKPFFRTQSLPMRHISEYTTLVRALLQMVMADAPPSPFKQGENFHFLPVGLFDPEEPQTKYDLIIARDIFGVPKGINTEYEFKTVLRNFLRYRRESGSLFFFPIDYAEDLVRYRGDSFFPWLREQDLASHELELVPPSNFDRIHLSRISCIPNALKGAFAWLRPISENEK